VDVGDRAIFLDVSAARVLVLALALTHAAGLADLLLGDACEDTCSDDGCGNDCLPGAACRCHCPSAMAALGSHPQVVVRLAAPRAIAPCAYDRQAHASPDPREILHVPRYAV
jgi:hypothetical protein